MANPPRIPTRIADNGEYRHHVVVATTRGTTSFLIGSVPRARIALICSVTSIDPSSDAMPDPRTSRHHQRPKHRAEFAHERDADRIARLTRRAESLTASLPIEA